VKPNFFIIGAARSGTTSLYAYLDQHPEIFFSQVKEINFFSNPEIWKKGFKWYESHFNKAKDAKAIGEASTSYTASPFLDEAPQRLARYKPDAKLIYIVRDPVDRIISHYMHRVHRGLESRPFSAVIDNLEAEPTAWQGRYYYQLQQYLKVFDRKQVLIISFDDLHNSADSVMSTIFSFLGVDSNFSVKDSEKIFNASSGSLRRSDFGIRILRFYRRHLEYRRLPFFLKKQFLKLASVRAVKHDRPSLTEHQCLVLNNFYAQDSNDLAYNLRIDTASMVNKR
jgi:hypothetical protein